ncbi:hypothetical protein NECAME_01834 [Necator americanus]|uniref:Uncharacterized protein n=1 Tax=Necator americanus TaxID=51031 RepID=W2TLQ1_NECAM|nr:hypothetical protein NECAME_01834 [Necator americanus]ETN83035.1 hypothetical protein NECAME_01834 [Necator americanus]
MSTVRKRFLANSGCNKIHSDEEKFQRQVTGHVMRAAAADKDNSTVTAMITVAFSLKYGPNHHEYR